MSGARKADGGWTVSVPPHVVAHLSGWGPMLKRAVEQGFRCWLDRNPGTMQPAGKANSCALVGTDFSGIEAPIWALRELGIRFRHVFACERKAGPRSIAAWNTPAEITFNDILRRPVDQVPQVNMYISGFPCTPFSTLHNRTRLMQDRNAKQFRASVKTLHHIKPPVAIFENVLGARRVLNVILRALRRNGEYKVMTVEMNASHLGEPQHRPRLYFICVRSDVAVGSENEMQDLAEFVWQSLRAPKPRSCDSQLLPSCHPLVVADSAKPRTSQSTPRQSQQGWKAQHEAVLLRPCAKGAGQIGGTTLPTGTELGLRTPRELDAWAHICRAYKHGPLCVDISQSLGRGIRTDGASPTVTPAGRFVVVCGHVRRQLVAIEKLMLQGFPVHQMRFPSTCTSNALGACGGNAMSIKCVAVAILLALTLVTDINSRIPGHGGVTPELAHNRAKQSRRKRTHGGLTPQSAPHKRARNRLPPGQDAPCLESLFG